MARSRAKKAEKKVKKVAKKGGRELKQFVKTKEGAAAAGGIATSALVGGLVAPAAVAYGAYKYTEGKKKPRRRKKKKNPEEAKLKTWLVKDSRGDRYRVVAPNRETAKRTAERLIMQGSKITELKEDKRPFPVVDVSQRLFMESQIFGFKIPKGRNPEKNPCVGLHLHASDFEPLMEAAQKVEKKRKKNPEALPYRMGIWHLVRSEGQMSEFKSDPTVPGFQLYVHYKVAGGTIFDLYHRGKKVASRTWKVKRPTTEQDAVEAAAKWSSRLVRKELSGSAALNPKTAKTPEYKRLIDRCRKLWDKYCATGLKRDFTVAGKHLEKMKASTSKLVAKERSKCLRAYNAEKRARGW